MTAIEYIFVPNDGTFERTLSGREAASQIFIDDSAKQTRFSDLLDKRSVDVPFWLCENGVMIRGTREQARSVSRMVEELPNLVPSAASVRESRENAAANITPAFADAAARFRYVPKIHVDFDNAANDTGPTVVNGRKPRVTGAYLQYAA